MIQRMLTQKQASNIMIGLLLAVIVFHLFILTTIIPYENVWGGKLKNEEEMYFV